MQHHDDQPRPRDHREETTVKAPGSLDGSLAFLQQQDWWPAFRTGRSACVNAIDDVLWVGHFCRWLQMRHIAFERCTHADLDSYLGSIAAFRPGPRAACERTVTALIDFVAADGANDSLGPIRSNRSSAAYASESFRLCSRRCDD